MKSKRSSVIWIVPKDVLQKTLDESSTYREIIQKLGIIMNTSQGMHYSRLRTRIQEDNLDLTQFLKNKEIFFSMLGKRSSRKLSGDCFTENSKFRREHVKSKLLEKTPYVCEICKCTGIHNNKPLVLELDHKNQVNNDNRVENLRFLCPNCHSQITNEFRRSNKLPSYDVCKCGSQKCRRSSSCVKCANINKAKVSAKLGLLTRSGGNC